MPNAVTFGAGQRTLSYGYDANGEKHSVAHTSSSGTSVTEYCDNVIYRNGSPAILLTEIGYYSFADGRYHTYIRDWQGNNRVVLRDDGLVEELNDYYASGCRIGGADKGVQPYKYSGKELDTFGDLNWYDFGARHYDPVLMRWTTTDPLSEKYYGISPYAFCNNDPVNYVDLDGKAVETLWDIASIGMGVRSFVKNIKSGNVRGAVGDAVGVAVDAVAAAVPFVPGGVGAVRAGAKAVNAAGDAIDAVKAVDAAKDAGKAVKNPFGAKGKLDHQNKVEELANQAEKELRFGERIETESQIKVGGSKRRPDVQILDKDGKTRKVFEAERHPNSKRNRLREEEYNRLGIEYETHSLN